MKHTVDYNNREQLYETVLKALPLKKIADYFNDQAFGNFFVTFEADNFFIQYSNDRGDLYLEIASKYAPAKWHSLSFYKNFIMNKRPINSSEDSSDLKGIKQVNEFLIKEYKLLNDLLNKENYAITLHKLEELLMIEFKQKYPGAIEE